jgi:hypothetical protein
MPANWDAFDQNDSSETTGELGVTPIPPPVLNAAQIPTGMKTPVTDKFMADPDFAAKVKEHAAKLRAVETQARGGDPISFLRSAQMGFAQTKDTIADVIKDIKGSFLSARDSQELLGIRAKQVLGTASDNEGQRASYLSARRQPWSSPEFAGNDPVTKFILGAPGQAAGMAGAWAGDDSVGGMIMAGAGLGTLMSPGKGTVAGASAGLMAGITNNAVKTGMGEFYDQMLRTKAPDGSLMKEPVARGAALVVGAVNGALGVLPLGKAMGTGLSSALFGGSPGKALLRLLTIPEAQTVLSRVATQFAAGAGVQAVIGGIQELNTIAAEHIVMTATDPTAYDGDKGSKAFDDELGRIKQSIKGGAQAGLSVGAFDAMLHRAGDSVTLHENTGAVVSKVFQEERGKAKEFFDRVATDNNIKSVTLPREKLAKFLEEIGLEGDDLKEAMPEVHDQMTETEGDPKAEISLTMGDVAGYIAPTPQWQGIKNDLRDGAGNLTINELRGMSKNLKGDVKATEPKMSGELKAIYQDVYGQLAKTKTMSAAAERAATLWTSTVNAIAEATGASPGEIHKKAGLQFVEKPEAALDERAAGVPGATVSDTGKYRVMKFDEVLPDDMTKYLGKLRDVTREEKDIKKNGTFGELFARLTKTTGSATDAARVLGGMGWDGIDTGKTKIVWRPDAVLPKSDPLKLTRGATEFTPGKTVISFSEHANVGTVVHEMAHVFLRLWHGAVEMPGEAFKPVAGKSGIPTEYEATRKVRVEQFDKAEAEREQKFRKALDGSRAAVEKTADEEYKAKEEALRSGRQDEIETQGDPEKLDDKGGEYLEQQGKLANERKYAVKEEQKAKLAAFKEEQKRRRENFNDELDKADKTAPKPEAPEATKSAQANPRTASASAAFEKLRTWLGATDASGALTPEAEEKFSRAFVDYLKHGEAPTATLRPVFDSYKAWLTGIYGTESALGKPLSPEIRQVFDKLVASQRAIQYAKENLGSPIFQTKPDSMTDIQFEKYKKDFADLAATAQSSIEREILAHMGQEGIDAFEKQKKAVTAEMLAKDQTHNLVSFLKTGERLTDGPIPVQAISPLGDEPGHVIETHKLDTDALKHMGLSDEALAQLSEYHEKAGLDPAHVAMTFGQPDAHSMVQALKSYIPLDRAAASAAAAQMPGWTDPVKWLKGRAIEKFSGDVIPKTLWAEFKALGGKLSEHSEGSYDNIRDAVRNEMRHVSLSHMDPGYYLSEYHRLGDEIPKAQRDQIASGLDLKKEEFKPADKDAVTVETKPLPELLAEKHGGTPAEWKARLASKGEAEPGLTPAELQRRRMVAFEKWRLARQAFEDLSVTNGLLSKMRNDFALRKSIAENLGHEHVEAFDSAAAAYGFYEPEVPPETPIGEYVQKQVKKGADIIEDPELERRAASRTPLKDLTINQLAHAQDFLTSFYNYVTRDLGKFDSGAGPKPLAPMLTRMAKSITDNFGRAKEKDPSRLRGMVAALTTPEHIFRLLDNDIHGDIARAALQPVEDGKATFEGWREDHHDVLKKMVEPINDGSLIGDSTLRIRNVESTDPITSRKLASKGKLLTKTELLSALINFGSSRNRWALLEGYGITEGELLSAVAHDLSPKHIEFANKFWAEHERWFPEEAKTYAKRTGLTLEAVKPMAFTVEFEDGTKAEATGGYVPIRMSAKVKNERSAQNVRAAPSSSFEVRDDMTQERTGSYGPVELDLGRVLSSVTAKLHYAAMAEPVAQVSKVVLSREFRDAVSQTIGPEYNDQIYKWLRDTAQDGNPLARLGDWDRVYRYLLSGVSHASVGLNHLTAIKQLPFALSQATSRVGLGNMTAAFRDTMLDWRGTWERALDESAVLRRMNDEPTLTGMLTPFDPNISVSVTDKLQQIGHGKVFQTASDVRAYMSELGMAHQNNVRQIGALLAYEAAKRRAIKENRPDVIQYAEALMRQTTGGGTPASFVREPGMARGTVVLYSHMSLIASDILSSATKLKTGGLTRQNLLNMTASLMGFLVMPSLAAAIVSDDSKDMSNPSDHPDKFISEVLRWEILGHGLSRMVPIFGDSVSELFAPDKPSNKLEGGPTGQVAGAVRGVTNAIVNPKKHLSDAIPAVMQATSIFTHTPTYHMYKDADLLEGIISGRYGGDFHKWYDIMAHGPKKEGFK